MGLSLSPDHLKRYKDIARLFLKYGHSDLVVDVELDEPLTEPIDPAETPSTPKAEELAKDLEQLGPTYVKLGQLLSTRADLLPMPYLAALARLQDNVGPFPFEEVEQIVTDELGVRMSKAFQSFEPKPLAAASLGQVHRAVLRSGQDVVVKVQRPNIREIVETDLKALGEIARFLDERTGIGERYDIPGMLTEFRRSLLQELDYRQEARNLRRLDENVDEFEGIIVPRPVADYTTECILTMEYVRGRKITKLSPVARVELDGERLADQLFEAYLKQILVDGFFHADPHPGNVFITNDGRIALLDLGMVARVSPAMQQQLLKLLLAVSEGEGDKAADVAIDIGEITERFDERGFRRQITDVVNQARDATAKEIQVGRIVIAVAHMAGEHGIIPPVELTMVGKTLLNLDLVGRTLDPDFEPNRAIRSHAGSILRRRMLHAMSPANVISRAMEMNELVQHLPDRLNTVLQNLSENRFELKVDAFDESRFIAGMQRIANRITVGLVLAALIIGAAMMMRVETTFRIWGYPGLAILLFLAAVAGGVIVLFDILFHDEKPEKH